MTLPYGWGVGIPPSITPDPSGAIATLRPKWWMNWGAYWAGRSNSDTYLPMMYKGPSHRNPDYFTRAIRDADNPWLLGNEYDLNGQANQTPSEAITHITEILRMGVTEWIGPNCCLNNRTFGWGWMDEYVRLSGPIPDAWGVHFYDCKTPAQFKDKFYMFEQWMKQWNVVRPVIVTETSAEKSSDTMQINLMDGINDFMNGSSLLRAVAWFSARYNYASDLLDAGGNLTRTGEAFRSLS